MDKASGISGGRTSAVSRDDIRSRGLLTGHPATAVRRTTSARRAGRPASPILQQGRGWASGNAALGLCRRFRDRDGLRTRSSTLTHARALASSRFSRGPVPHSRNTATDDCPVWGVGASRIHSGDRPVLKPVGSTAASQAGRGGGGGPQAGSTYRRVVSPAAMADRTARLPKISSPPRITRKRTCCASRALAFDMM